MRTIYYGVMTASTLISLRYNAAQRYYFETGLPAFEAAFRSLRLSNYSWCGRELFPEQSALRTSQVESKSLTN